MDLLIPLALAALLIFFLFNSRRKQKARAEQIKSGLVPGAKVMTTFGVYGTVLSIDEADNQVTIESGPGTVLRVHRQAIGQIENPEAPADIAPLGDVTPADEATAKDGENPAITDAELDAMNERKRSGGDDDTDLTAGATGDTADSTDVTETDVTETEVTKDGVTKDEIDVTESDEPKSGTAGTDRTTGTGTDSAKGLGTDSPDSDDKKN